MQAPTTARRARIDNKSKVQRGSGLARNAGGAGARAGARRGQGARILGAARTASRLLFISTCP